VETMERRVKLSSEREDARIMKVILIRT